MHNLKLVIVYHMANGHNDDDSTFTATQLAAGAHSLSTGTYAGADSKCRYGHGFFYNSDDHVLHVAASKLDDFSEKITDDVIVYRVYIIDFSMQFDYKKNAPGEDVVLDFRGDPNRSISGSLADIAGEYLKIDTLIEELTDDTEL